MEENPGNREENHPRAVAKTKLVFVHAARTLTGIESRERRQKEKERRAAPQRGGPAYPYVSVRVRRHRSHWPESLDEIPFIEEDDNYHTDFRGDEGDQ
jgi:hypothetical protein